MAVHSKLLEIQRDLKVEKGQWNSFSDFAYRSKEDILEEVKPLAHERGCVVLCDDTVEHLPNGWVYCKSVATLYDCETGESVSASGNAREPESKKGMDASQITGTASSYAGKRALGNLFAIDDTKDADMGEKPVKTVSWPANARCRSCGATYSFQSEEHLSQWEKSPQSCCPSPSYEVL